MLLVNPLCRRVGDGVPALIADLEIRGAWIPQIEALFNIRITDSDASSYTSRSATDVLVAAKEEKKNMQGFFQDFGQWGSK